MRRKDKISISVLSNQLQYAAAGQGHAGTVGRGKQQPRHRHLLVKTALTMATIIIADDHPVTLNGVSQYLPSLGYRILKQYTNGIEACNNILTLQPDYAVLDIFMPGMSGLEVLEKLRTRNKTVKVILYTLYADTALFEKAKTLGVNGCVLKDFALEEPKDCLHRLKFQKQWFSPKLGEALEAPPAAPMKKSCTAFRRRSEKSCP